MNAPHTARGDEPFGAAEEADRRSAAALVRDADAAPWDCMAEGFARRFLRGEESREPLGEVAPPLRVGHLFLCIYLSAEPRERALVEAVALDLGEIETNAQDHEAAFEAGDKFSGLRRRSYRSGMAPKIHIVPVNAVDSGFLDRLALCVEERFLAGAVIEPALPLSRSALNVTRAQLFLSTLTSKALRAHPEQDGALLVLTDFDLYKTSHRFIFGGSDEVQRLAAVSTHRLRPEFYGEEHDANVLFQRTLKEAVHELGHVFGLKHCFNPRCGMYASNSVYETDNKTSYFCETCDRRVSRAHK